MLEGSQSDKWGHEGGVALLRPEGRGVGVS